MRLSFAACNNNPGLTLLGKSGARHQQYRAVADHDLGSRNNIGNMAVNVLLLGKSGRDYIIPRLIEQVVPYELAGLVLACAGMVAGPDFSLLGGMVDARPLVSYTFEPLVYLFPDDFGRAKISP